MGNNTVTLSVLEFGYLGPNQDARLRLQAVVDHGPVFEAMGFHRYWLAEHHEAHFAFAVPELMIPAIAAKTSTIRLGTAGVLMQFHSPLRIAESFRMLEALYPDRIDCGVASGVTAHVEVRKDLYPDFDLDRAIRDRQYTQHVERLITLLRDEAHYDHRHYRSVSPARQASPAITLLGAARGKGNQILASRHGTAFCYSLAHGPSEQGPAICQRYRENFQASKTLQEPKLLIAATVICAETNAKAVEYLNYLKAMNQTVGTVIMGNPRLCRDKILQLCEQFQCHDFVIIPMYPKAHQVTEGMERLMETFS